MKLVRDVTLQTGEYLGLFWSGWGIQFRVGPDYGVVFRGFVVETRMGDGGW